MNLSIIFINNDTTKTQNIFPSTFKINPSFVKESYKSVLHKRLFMVRFGSHELNLKNKTVLVTGGTGFIGSHICEEALKLGAKVIALDNLCASTEENVSHLKGNNFQFVNGDIRDYHLIKELVDKTDYIFNQAASKMVSSRDSPIRDLDTNARGTLNIMEAIRHSDNKPIVIHASTGSVLGSTDEEDMREDHPRLPTSHYGISKLAGEEYCRFYANEFGVKVKVLRYFHVFGPRQDYSGEAGVVSIFLSNAMKRKPLKIFNGGDQIRCFTYIKDDVNANFLLAAIPDGWGEMYHVASKTRMTINELAKIIIKKYGKKGVITKDGGWRLGENPRPIPDTSKLEELGFKEETSFEDGLDTTAKWVQQKEGL
jgi:UDP-glucose 4-epimerase